jgi:hypothetical protein
VSLPFASPTRKQDNKHGQPHDTGTKIGSLNLFRPKPDTKH